MRPLFYLPCLVSLALPLCACAATPAHAPGEVAPAAVAGVPLLESGRVLMLGDSITQDGRYVSFIEYLLQRAYPEKSFDIISAGLASETVSGLSEPGHAGGKFPRPDVKKRLARALAEVKPAVVIACYGMNDGIYKPYDESRMKAFRDGMGELAAACAKAGAKLVLVTPPVYDEARDGSRYDSAVLAAFAAWEMKSAPASVAKVVDLHTPMRRELDAARAKNPAFVFAGDKIHPNDDGHLFMALTILRGLGVPTPEGPRDGILAGIKADPAWARVHRRREARSKAWLEHIGYEREKSVPPGTGDIAKAESAAETERKAIAAAVRSAPSK